MYFKWLVLFTTEYKLNFLLLPHPFLWGGCTPNGGRKLAPHLHYAVIENALLLTLSRIVLTTQITYHGSMFLKLKC